MSTAKHTPGEWAIDPDSDSETIAICNGDGEHVCILQIDTDYPAQVAEANAARIVACKNGCEGINPAAVKDMWEACNVALDEIITMQSLLCDAQGTEQAINGVATMLEHVIKKVEEVPL